MMDMKASYLDGKTYYPFHPVQTDHMMQLVNASDGKLIGFTAFNPKNSDAMLSVTEGLAKGNIGVKFYLQMGYKPYGDADDSVRNNVSELFKMCSDKTPIFAHCTPVGFQAAKRDGLNCNPDYWKTLLEQEGYKNQRICFGHAGGGDPKIKGYDFHGWYSNEDQWKRDDCYARKIVYLCQCFENVYCEVAYLNEILKGKEKKDLFVTNLIRNFDNEEAEFKLKDKICFGTDWHMIEMVNAQEEYYNAFVLIF